MINHATTANKPETNGSKQTEATETNKTDATKTKRKQTEQNKTDGEDVAGAGARRRGI